MITGSLQGANTYCVRSSLSLRPACVSRSALSNGLGSCGTTNSVLSPTIKARNHCEPLAGNRTHKLTVHKQHARSPYAADGILQQQASALTKNITKLISSSSSLQELQDVVDEWGSSFDFIHTAAAFSKAAKLGQKNRPADTQKLLKILAAIWDSQLPDAGARELANVLWACGKLQCTDSSLWSSTLEAFLQQQKEAKCLELSNVIHAMSVVAARNKGAVPGVSREGMEQAVRQLMSRMHVIVAHPRPEGVVPQDVANAMWACAKLRINPGDAELRGLLQAFVRPALLGSAQPQEIANVVYAVGELQQNCSWQVQARQQVWQQLLGEPQLKKVADKGTPQNVANVLLTLARLSDGDAPPISRQCGAECAVQLLQGSVARRLGQWKAQEIGNSMWACAKLGLCHDQFMQQAAATASSWLPQATEVEVTQVAWACGTLQFKQPQLLAGVVQHSKQILQHGKQHLSSSKRYMTAMVSWAVAVLDLQQLAGDVVAIIAASGVQKLAKLNSADAGRLWVVHTWLLQHQLLDGQGLALLLTHEQLAVCQEAAIAESGAQLSEE